MALTDAQRRANNKWDRANMKVLACKVRKDKAEVFRQACKAAGTTPNAVFTQAMDAFLAKAQKETETEAPDTAEEG